VTDLKTVLDGKEDESVEESPWHVLGDDGVGVEGGWRVENV
jgi:hypothetical protein